MMGSRFVVQEHTTIEGIHWDLMLEQDDILITFRLEAAPKEAVRRAIRAQRTFDHPIKFLDYEGPVQRGTGQVRIIDRGTYRLEAQRGDVLEVGLEGTILRANLTLTRAEGATWYLTSKGAEN
jgi:bifunctional non-homologous end joining protein LigD